MNCFLNRSKIYTSTFHWTILVFVTVLIHGSIHAQQAVPAKTFDSTVKPFLAKHCYKCHGEKKQRGDISLHKLNPKKLTNDAKKWANIVEVLAFGKMPPASQPRPETNDVKQVTTWIKKQLAAVGKDSDVDHKLQHPSFANLIDHEKLFDGSINGPAFSPPRLWRLHPKAYEAYLERFGKNLERYTGPLSKPFLVGDGKGLPSNYAELANADSATLGQLMQNCKQIAQLQTVGFKVKKKDNRTKKEVEVLFRAPPKTFQAIMDGKGEPTTEQIRAAVIEEFKIVLNRTPSETELQAFQGLLKKAIGIGGKALGLRTMAMAILLRPEAIYRVEVGLGNVDEHGRRMLSPYELAHVIAYALTDSPPDQVLLGPPRPNDRSKRPTGPSLIELAKTGKLKTREDVRQAVTKIWESEAIKKPRILRFFQEFFGYHLAGTVFKGDRGFRGYSPRHLIKDVDTLVMHIVKEDRDVLKELLTTDRYFFQWPGSRKEYDRRVEYIVKRLKKKTDPNYKYFITRKEKTGKNPIPQANPGWRKMTLLFNLDPNDWDYPLEQPFAMPKGQRSGILTHPAWLAAWSSNFENDPIRRGKWIREHLLAGSIPEVPITVDATVPQDPHKTLRQRLMKTRQDYCWQCHRKMDPLGLPFESYTDFGRYREQEALGPTKALQRSRKTAPVVSTGEIIDSGDPDLDGKVKNVEELMHKLANSKRVRQSFVRHAFRYWLGRNESLIDSPSLIAADRAYVENGGSFKAMVISLLTSDSFLYRK